MYTIAAYIMCSVCVLQITDDLRVVATTREQRQNIRAHELLETNCWREKKCSLK